MPILAEETSIYPDNLLDNPADPDDDRRWWAVYTMARQEKALARQLLGYEIPFYLPLVKKDRYSRGRRLCSYLPLFDGYVFLHGTEDERVRTLTTNRISRILPVRNQDELLADLSRVKHLIESDAPLTVEKRLRSGHRVRIKSGALKGLEGTIIRRNNGNKGPRLLVAVNYLQQGVSVEIDDFMVEPI